MDQNETLKNIILDRLVVIQQLLNSLFDTVHSTNQIEKSSAGQIKTALSLIDAYYSEKFALDQVLRTFESQNKKVG